MTFDIPDRKMKEEKEEEIDEEPLFLSPEDGYGYYPSAAAGAQLGQYQIVRKVSLSILASWCD
jgi:hypothetical protein